MQAHDKFEVVSKISCPRKKHRKQLSLYNYTFLLVKINYIAPSKCITISSVLIYLMFFILMNNTLPLNIFMLSFRYYYIFISFR